MSLFRLLAALCCFTVSSVPALAADTPNQCRYGLKARLPLQYHGTSMSVSVDGKLDDKPAAMLIDTGASVTFLTRFATDKRAMELEPTHAWVTGLGGSSRLYNAKIRSIELGPIRANRRSVLRAIDETGSRADFDALIGADFLLDMDLEISLAEKQLRFFAPQNCDTTFLAYWDKAAFAVPLLFEEDEQRPLVEVSINGIKMRALIDSGATFSKVSLDAARRAGVTLDSPGVKRRGSATGIGSKTLALYNASFTSFAIGEEHIKNATLSIGESRSLKHDVILGTDFMRAHRMLFAVSQKTLYLSYVGGPAFDDGGKSSNAWVEQEAREGNAYAQYLTGREQLRVEDSAAQAAGMAWIAKAVASKNPPAMRSMAHHHADEERHAEAMALYDSVLALDPHDLSAHLEAFVLRHKAGQGETAKPALAKALTNFRWPRWPAPIVDYYLGKSSLDELLRSAAKDSDTATRRRCEVYFHAQALQEALGQAEQASALQDKARLECGH